MITTKFKTNSLSACSSIMQAIINHSLSTKNNHCGNHLLNCDPNCGGKNENFNIISIMLVAQDLPFFQGLKSLLSFYQANPLWQFNIVAEAKTQTQAIKVAMQRQPSLILLDIDYYQEQEVGIKTLMELNRLFNKKNQQKVKIIAISSHREEKVIFLTMQAGALGYILKENLPSQLYTAMLTVINGQVYLCPEVVTQFFRGFHLYGQACFTDQPSSDDSLKSFDNAHPYHLTQREKEVLELLVKGYCNEEIAKRLYITIATVKAHLTAIFEKLGVKNRSKAIVRSLELGIV